LRNTLAQVLTNKVIKYFFFITCTFLTATSIAKEGIHQIWELELQKKHKQKISLKARKLKQSPNQAELKKGSLLNLPISSKVSLLAKVNKVVESDDSRTYIAEVIDESSSVAVITVGKAQVFATISSSEKIYQLHVTDKFTTLNKGQKLDANLALDMENDIYQPSSKILNSAQQLSQFSIDKISLSHEQETNESNDVAQVDLMVVYTERMAEAYDGEPLTRIQHLVNLTNQIFEDSGVLINLNLIHSEPVNYEVTDAHKSMDDLSAYTTPFDTTVINNRFMKRADLLTLVDIGTFASSGNIIAGIANLPGGTPNTHYNSLPVSIISADSGGDTILAHELGHNLGLGHSRRQNDIDGKDGIFPYAIGYGVDNTFVTIMAYQEVFDAPQILKYSSPLLDCLGVPCGVDIALDPENGTDAVKALNEMRFAAEDYLDSSVSVVPITELISSGADSCTFLAKDGSSAYFTEQTISLSCADNKSNTLTFLQENPFQFVSFFSFNSNGEEVDTELLSQTLGKNLYSFELENSIPINLSALQVFSQLEVINIQDSSFTGENISPDDFDSLNNLQSFRMWNNELTTISFIDGIELLFELDAHNNNITSVEVLNNNYENLKTIKLSNNLIKDISPIANYLELDTLGLSYNPIDDLTQFSFLSNNSSLRQLFIAGLGIEDDGVIHDYISNIAVENLDLSENNLHTVPDVSHMLVSNISLIRLHLHSNNIKNIHNEDWLTQLKYLDLHSNNIYDISSLLTFDGWLLNLNDNPVFCWQKDLLIKNIEQLNESRDDNITLYVHDECTTDLDNDLMPDQWESNYGLDPEDPLDAQLDSDNDGIINLDEFRNDTEPTSDSDSDGDGVNDGNDAFPNDPNEWLDTDGDGIGNNADTDDDGDGVDDSSDAFPLDASKSIVPETQKPDSSGGGGSPSGFLLLLLFSSIVFQKVNRINKTAKHPTT